MEIGEAAGDESTINDAGPTLGWTCLTTSRGNPGRSGSDWDARADVAGCAAPVAPVAGLSVDCATGRDRVSCFPVRSRTWRGRSPLARGSLPWRFFIREEPRPSRSGDGDGCLDVVPVE